LVNFMNGRRERLWHRALTITDAGLALGRGTVLARMSPDAPSQLAIAGEEERILALLSVAFTKSAPVETVGYMVRALEQWSRGDKCVLRIFTLLRGSATGR
jgi:hypothetical protein